MTVQELIEELEKIEDKSVDVFYLNAADLWQEEIESVESIECRCHRGIPRVILNY
jgi:hypothetical protein